ncbi:MAG: hypothetical protein AAGA54_16230 [Myxococcota bacterium]
MRSALLGVCGLWLGCASSTAPVAPTAPASATAPEPTEAAPAEQVDPAARLDALEASLLSQTVRLRFAVQSTGVVEAQFVGALAMDGQAVELRAAGSFAGTPVELRFEADGARMTGTGGARDFDLPQPAGLRDAIAIGLVRMGLLHTLAVLSAGMPPDHADGDVRSWLSRTVQPGAPTVAVMEPAHDALPADPITFVTAVEGEDALTATLWFDDGVPVERQQQTRFPDGTMDVQESFDPL